MRHIKTHTHSHIYTIPQIQRHNNTYRPDTHIHRQRQRHITTLTYIDTVTEIHALIDTDT